MSDPNAFTAQPPMGSRAGDLLREAREAQGLEIDGLASMIKVTPAKLEYPFKRQGRVPLLRSG